jgi:NDP-sugar pyrophosphorylase family protein
VIEFVEKPPVGEAPTDLINAGTYVLEPSVLARIDAGRRVSVEREVFPALVDDGSLFAVDGETYWIDTGTPETYIQAQLDLTEGLRGEPLEAVDSSATIDPAATVVRSVVGPGAVVEAGARVEGAVLLGGAVVRRDAVVEGSAVGFGAEIAAGAHVGSCCVIGDREVVAAGARLDGVKQPPACP